MSTFNKEYDGLADAIITNVIVMPAVELKEGEKFPPYIKYLITTRMRNPTN